jgi:fatty acid desaturase
MHAAIFYAMLIRIRRVLAQVPRVQTMDVVTPPYRVNAWLVAVAFMVAALQLVIFPLALLPETDGMSIALADVVVISVTILLSLTTPFTRALLHEGIHARLVRTRLWSDRISRLLSICFGISFDAVRLGHMTHHRFPRHALDRPDILEPGKARFGGIVNFYVGLAGWIYAREILSSFAMLLPRRIITRIAEFALPQDESSVALHGTLRRGLDRRLGRIRLDSIAVILLYGGAFYLYGAWWPVLVIALALRGLIVSLQDNVAHYDTPAVVGAPAHNTYTARWASFFMLNSNLHGVHHDHPELPWHVLPATFSARGEGYSGGYFTLLMKQFSGPLPADPAQSPAAPDATGAGMSRA